MSVSLDSISLPSLAANQVPRALYRRHLGLPACAELNEPLEALFEQAKNWYEQQGNPWSETKHVAIHRIANDVVHLEDQQQLSSALLARGLAQAEAHSLVIVAISAGKVVDEQIDTLWKTDRVDEAMFLNAYAIATVEHLRWQVGDHLRNTLAESKSTVLPHYSPGYDGWDLADQARLYQLIGSNGQSTSMPLQLLASGGLSPSKSTLTAYGITQRTDFDENFDQYWSYQMMPNSSTLSPASYAFPEKALTRWRDKRLTVIAQPNQELLAKFRFDGSTCTNMGTPLAFEYEVRLQLEENGEYRILDASCKPAEGHTGYQSMCAFLDQPERYNTQLNTHRPLVGQLLSQSLTWKSPASPAGCLCTRASQDHKWRIVFQTLYFALQDHE